jgi:hypothetical protein
MVNPFFFPFNSIYKQFVGNAIEVGTNLIAKGFMYT